MAGISSKERPCIRSCGTGSSHLIRLMETDMAGNSNEESSGKMIYFCLKGHGIIKKGKIINRVCPICGSAIDMTKPMIPYEKWQEISQQQKKEQEESAQQAPVETEEQEPPVEEGTTDFTLDYFGDKLQIPREGGWIGREGLGREWFDGNLMISRQHVYVCPDLKTGRLLVSMDKSLNGVFYSGPGGEKTRMEGPRMLKAGEVLWIYNIPLVFGS